MKEKSVKKKTETILNLLDSKEDMSRHELTSMDDSLLGTSVIKAFLDKAEGNLVWHFQMLNKMAGEGALLRGVDYDTTVDYNGEFLLELNYRVFYSKFLKYCEKLGVSSKAFTLYEFKKLLSSMSCCRCYNIPVWFNEYVDGTYVGKKLYRAAIIELRKLKTAGVNLKNFYGSEI